MPRQSQDGKALNGKIVPGIEIYSFPTVFSGRTISTDRPLRTVSVGVFRLIHTL